MSPEGAAPALLVSFPSCDAPLSLSELDDTVERDKTADRTRDTLEADLLSPFAVSETEVLPFAVDNSLEMTALGMSAFSSEIPESPLVARVPPPLSDFSARNRKTLITPQNLRARKALQTHSEPTTKANTCTCRAYVLYYKPTVGTPMISQLLWKWQKKKGSCCEKHSCWHFCLQRKSRRKSRQLLFTFFNKNYNHYFQRNNNKNKKQKQQNCIHMITLSGAP